MSPLVRRLNDELADAPLLTHGGETWKMVTGLLFKSSEFGFIVLETETCDPVRSESRHEPVMQLFRKSPRQRQRQQHHVLEVCDESSSRFPVGGGGGSIRWRLLGSPVRLPSRSVTRRVAALPGVGLRTEPLSLPHHRLHHRGWSSQELSDVVLLHQAVQNALRSHDTKRGVEEVDKSSNVISGLHVSPCAALLGAVSSLSQVTVSYSTISNTISVV